MSDNLGAYHPAWRDSIIPFLKDQDVLDQLWCCTHIFHHTILTKVMDLICYARPVDLPNKKKGIYPSYISKMTGLRTLYVTRYPRIRIYHYGFCIYHCDEIFSEKIPPTLIYFDVDSSILKSANLMLFLNAHFIPHAGTGAASSISPFDWLDKFPDITIGDGLKHTFSKTPKLHPTNIADSIKALSAPFPPWFLKYQFVSSISITDFTKIMDALTLLSSQYDISSLIERFTTGIKALTNDQEDPTPGVYHTVYHLLPNLEEITGVVPSFPLQLTRYTVNRSPDIFHKISLPHHVKDLTIVWNLVETSDLSMLSNLTRLQLIGGDKVYDSIPAVGACHATPEQFKELIFALPQGLTSLSILNVESKMYRRPNYWTVDVLQALPRGLLELCANHGDAFKSKQHYQALPPGLTSINLTSEAFEPQNGLLLPKGLKTVVLGVEISRESVHALELIPILRHFTSIVNLTLKVGSTSLDRTISWVFPSTVENFTIKVCTGYWYSSNTEVNLSEFLSMIVWSSAIRSIEVQNSMPASAGEVSLANPWNLPSHLEKLSLSNIIIKELPYQWPTGLQKFTTFNSRTKIFDIMEEINKVWPDIHTMKQYMPDPKWCYITYNGVGTIQGSTVDVQLVPGEDGGRQLKII